MLLVVDGWFASWQKPIKEIDTLQSVSVDFLEEKSAIITLVLTLENRANLKEHVKIAEESARLSKRSYF
jgi:hypothetical protein